MAGANWFDQHDYQIRLEWGRAGASRAAQRGDILVVVDVLSFSSAVVTAAAHGISIYPCETQADAIETARRVNGEAAVHRRDVPAKGIYSLSPVSFLEGVAGTRVAVASPNGATCSRYGRDVPCLIIACLLNAEAAAEAVWRAMERHHCPVTILVCGERWQEPNEDGELRFALEDYVGAGAVLSYLPTIRSRSPEAQAAQAAFSTMKGDLQRVLAECGSGRELIGRGYPQDVAHSAQLNRYSAVPVLVEGERFEPFEPVE